MEHFFSVVQFTAAMPYLYYCLLQIRYTNVSYVSFAIGDSFQYLSLNHSFVQSCNSKPLHYPV